VANYKDEIRSKVGNSEIQETIRKKLHHEISVINKESEDLKHQNELSVVYIRKQTKEETSLIHFLKTAEREQVKEEHALQLLLSERNNFNLQHVQQNMKLGQVYEALRLGRSNERNYDVVHFKTCRKLQESQKLIYSLRTTRMDLKEYTSDLKGLKHLSSQLENELLKEEKNKLIEEIDVLKKNNLSLKKENKKLKTNTKETNTTNNTTNNITNNSYNINFNVEFDKLPEFIEENVKDSLLKNIDVNSIKGGEQQYINDFVDGIKKFVIVKDLARGKLITKNEEGKECKTTSNKVVQKSLTFIKNEQNNIIDQVQQNMPEFDGTNVIENGKIIIGIRNVCGLKYPLKNTNAITKTRKLINE
jgi:hypothetical protein